MNYSVTFTEAETAAIQHVWAMVAEYGAHSVTMCPEGVDLHCQHAGAIRSAVAKGWDLTQGAWPEGGLRGSTP